MFYKSVEEVRLKLTFIFISQNLDKAIHYNSVEHKIMYNNPLICQTVKSHIFDWQKENVLHYDFWSSALLSYFIDILLSVGEFICSWWVLFTSYPDVTVK